MRKNFIKQWATALAFITLTMIQSGCDKDSDDDQDTTSSSIEGLWIGYYTVDGQPSQGQQYYSLVIKPDGTVINDTKGLNQQHLAIGAWTLAGNSFACTTTVVYGLPNNIDVTQTHTATFDKVNGTITNGIWTNISTPSNLTGTFTLTKVK